MLLTDIYASVKMSQEGERNINQFKNTGWLDGAKWNLQRYGDIILHHPPQVLNINIIFSEGKKMVMGNNGAQNEANELFPITEEEEEKGEGNDGSLFSKT